VERNLFRSKLRFVLIFLVIFTFPTLSLSETSVNVNLDSWVYPALERLASIGLIESGLMNTKPLTRMEVARLTGEAMVLMAERKPGDDTDRLTLYLLERLKKEFRDELSILGTIHNVKIETFIKPIDEISVKYRLLDGSYSIYNNDGIPYGDDNNASLEFSGRCKFFDTISLYYQPIYSFNQSLRAEEKTDFKLLRGYIKFNLGNAEFEIGRDSMWWGPGCHGSLLMTNNAEPFDMVKISNPGPILLPWIFRYIGPFKVTFILSKLDEERPVSKPYIYGLRLNAKPLPTLELGISHIAIFGGEGVDLSFYETIEVLYSNKNLTGNKESNQQFAVDFSLWIHNTAPLTRLSRSVKVYGELGAEDTGRPPDRRAYLVGLLFKDLFLTGRTDLQIEYVNTSPSSVPNSWYQHGKYPAFYKGRVFGHHVGTDAEDIFVRFIGYLTNNLIAGIDFDAETRGTSEAIREKHYQFGVDLSYNITDMIEIKGRYGFERVDNYNFVDGRDKDYHFFGGELTIRF